MPILQSTPSTSVGIGDIMVRGTVGLCILLLSGCHSAEQPRGNRTLTATIGYPEPHTVFAPGGGGGGPAFTSSKVLERLARYNADQTFSPVLAERWVIAPDAKSIDLVLRKNVKWHDGKPFTAEDVAFSVRDYWKKYYPDSILDFLEDVTVKSPTELTIRFSRPVPEFSLLKLMAGPANYVLPKHLYEGKDILLNPVNNAPVGTGPWKFKQWVRGSYEEFEKNPDYWVRGEPKLDKLIVRWWREPASRAAAFETGELDVGVSNPVPLGDVQRLQKNPKLNVSFQEEGLAVSVYFNVHNPVLSDRRVRQALLHAIDKKFIADTIYHGLAKPATGPILSSDKLYYTDQLPRYDYDPKLAARLLDEAGYSVKADGTRFRVNLVASGWSEENGKVGSYLKQVLGDLKIPAILRVPDRANSLKALYTDYDFDIAYSQGGGTPDEPVPELALLYTKAGISKGLIFRNASRYTSPAMEDLVGKITVEVDPAKRKQLIQAFARLAMTDVPEAPIVEWPAHIITQRDVRINSQAAAFYTDSWGSATKGK
ncbi:ABC transporter substrate-binding protein [Sphingomonas sp. AP4-R1]|uniref:ABC transporter substrate-binding protein n=1 Tax=Sphingomonas sp. AP4-R1 TaxID=2735134 RepID=UPI00149372E3|nr:ABC transporter substrate-binding protein [Sphingomonas sp. AP4-R1]QJU57357.1 ABC transporter substrate-binding protein [Sphingomonas sp. AP4-R1]